MKGRPGTRDMVYTLIDKERLRQQEKHAGNTFENADNAIPLVGQLAVLVKQVGHVAAAMQEIVFRPSRSRGDLRYALVKVAAVAVAMLENLEEVGP